MSIAGAIQLLEAERRKLDAAIAALTGLNGTGPADLPPRLLGPGQVAKPRANGQRKKEKAVAETTPSPDPRRAKARALWEKGKTVAEIAEAVGVTAWSIYNWRKVDDWPAQQDGQGRARRCQDCEQLGTGLTKCEHCGAPR